MKHLLKLKRMADVINGKDDRRVTGWFDKIVKFENLIERFKAKQTDHFIAGRFDDWYSEEEKINSLQGAIEDLQSKIELQMAWRKLVFSLEAFKK